MRISDWSSDVCSSDLLAVEHFIDAIGLADRGHQILHGQAALFHAETNCFDGVGRLDRGMPGFVGFHQRDQDLEAVAFLAARLRLVVEVSGHLAQCGLVIGLGTRSGERRVGKEGVKYVEFTGVPGSLKKKKKNY